LILAAFAVRASLFSLHGHESDLEIFQYWFQTAADHGIRVFYSSTNAPVDYPPLNVYLFWGFGSIAKSLALYQLPPLPPLPAMIYLIKLVPTIFDMFTAAAIFFFVKGKLNFKLGIIAAALCAFNPAAIFEASVWGQFDAIYTFFLVLSLIFAIKSNPKLSAVSFALGLLSKPQGIALAPLILFLIFKKNGVKKTLYSIGAFAATIFAVILPFEWSNPVTFLSTIYFGGYDRYPLLSQNAFNLWGLFGNQLPDGNLLIVGWLMFAVAAVFIIYVLNARFKDSGELLALFAAFMLFFSFFILETRMHERYLFPVISILALMFPFFKKTRPLYVVLTATVFVNLAYVLYITNYGLAEVNLTGDPVGLAVSVVNLVTFLYCLYLMVKIKPIKGSF
jgi:dolichyl-phosphate-mannose-protein mannosyltransferase